MPFDSDVFTGAAFTLQGLTSAINRMPYTPGIVGRLQLFTPRPLATTWVGVEFKSGRLALIPEQPRGSPMNRNVEGPRGPMVTMPIPHFPLADTVMADSVSNLRAFGTTDTLQTVQSEVDQRLASMNLKHDATLEHLRLGAVRGQIITVVDRETGAPQKIIDLFQGFGVPQPPVVEWPIAFDRETVVAADAWLAPVRRLITALMREMNDELGAGPMMSMGAICGSAFFDAILNAPERREALLNSTDTALLLNELPTAIAYAGCLFVEYRGKVGAYQFMPDDEAVFFPRGVPDLFIEAYAPADYMDTVNTTALRRYARSQPMDLNKGLMIETQQNVLPICTMPELLRRVKVTAAPVSPTSASAPLKA